MFKKKIAEKLRTLANRFDKQEPAATNRPTPLVEPPTPPVRRFIEYNSVVPIAGIVRQPIELLDSGNMSRQTLIECLEKEVRTGIAKEAARHVKIISSGVVDNEYVVEGRLFLYKKKEKNGNS